MPFATDPLTENEWVFETSMSIGGGEVVASAVNQVEVKTVVRSNEAIFSRAVESNDGFFSKDEFELVLSIEDNHSGDETVFWGNGKVINPSSSVSAGTGFRLHVAISGDCSEFFRYQNFIDQMHSVCEAGGLTLYAARLRNGGSADALSLFRIIGGSALGRAYLRVNSRGLSNVTDFEAVEDFSRDDDGEVVDNHDALSPISAMLVTLLALFYFVRVKGRETKY